MQLDNIKKHSQNCSCFMIRKSFAIKLQNWKIEISRYVQFLVLAKLFPYMDSGNWGQIVELSARELEHLIK